MSLGVSPPRAGRLDWAVDGRHWPHRETSRFIRAGGVDWHVQVIGQGPPVLALHGAGAASHSWADLATALSGRFSVIVPDLPGHGFSAPAPGHALPLADAARAVAALLAALGTQPRLAIGHSAGAAILARMSLDARPETTALDGIVGVNAALVPFRGVPGLVLPVMARLLHWNPLAAPLLATAAIDPNAVPGMIRGTGSRIGAEGLALYRRLFRAPSHVAGTLAMIANWDLAPLLADLPRLRPPLLLISGSRDLAVPPRQAREIAARLPSAKIVGLEGLGHLAHEEAPEQVAHQIRIFADRLGL
ncbi:MAG: alpha/beta fold hydrolase BchO [Pikeienuella sp.]